MLSRNINSKMVFDEILRWHEYDESLAYTNKQTFVVFVDFFFFLFF